MHSVSSRWHSPHMKSNKRKRHLQNLAQSRKNRRENANAEDSAGPEECTDLCAECVAMEDKETSENLCNLQEQQAQIENATQTSSEQKLSDFSPLEPDNQSEYIIIHGNALQQLYKGLKCPACECADINATTKETYGFAKKLHVVCGACGHCSAETYTSPRANVQRQTTRPPFDVNKKAAEAFLNMGVGHRYMQKFCMSMSMHCLDSKTFTSHMNQLAVETITFKEKLLNDSRVMVRRAHEAVDPSLVNAEILDIAVSYDGTWHKRGHTSLYGLGLVVDILTGLVIDYEILSKFCHYCVSIANDMDPETSEYMILAEEHRRSGGCCKNYDGASGSMEVHAAHIMWERSVQQCKMRYTTVLSDGDARTHRHLNEVAVYGIGVEIVKEECVNHVAKRMTTAFLKLKKDTTDTRLGGRSRGTLKLGTIKKLTSYYRQAIQKHLPNVTAMKNAIYATLYHYRSTDHKPEHQKCSSGTDSWCFYNRSIARGETPQSHSKMSVHFDDSMVKRILPIYQRLACNELLARCARGGTQNSNESVHSLIWKNCPKEIFISKKRLEIGAFNGVSAFNMGCSATQELKSEVRGEVWSAATSKISQVRDATRLYESRRSSTARNKAAAVNKSASDTSKRAKKDAQAVKDYKSGAF